MKTKAFAVYDSKAKFFDKPIYLRNSAEAIRAFETEANSGKSAISQYPADFTLFEVGEYDDETGLLTSEKAHINLGCALQYKKQSPTTPAQLTNISN